MSEPPRRTFLKGLSAGTLAARSRLAAGLVGGVVALPAVATPKPAAASGTGGLLRDTETERFLYRQSLPLIKAAGLDATRVQILVFDDSTINAFATASHLVALSAGLVAGSTESGELLGVIAHELGHIAAGHHVATQAALDNAGRLALLSTTLGILIAVAADEPLAGAALGGIGQEAAVKGFLSYSRRQEQAADQAAVNYLRKAGYDVDGLLEVMQRLQRQSEFSGGEGEEYLRTHPLSIDRVRFLENAVDTNPNPPRQTNAETEAQFQTIQSKLNAYRDPEAWERLHENAPPSPGVQYGRAIVDWRKGRLRDAVGGLNRLIDAEPDNPYYHELAGQVLYGAGQINESAAAYERAVALLPDAPMLQLGYAASLILTRTAPNQRLALLQLERVRSAKEAEAFTWKLSGIAHANLGEKALSDLALAEFHLLRGEEVEAAGRARLALEALPLSQGPARLRAQDVLAIIGESETTP